LRKRARPRIGGLSGTGEDGWIIELGADQRFVHWDWAWTSLDWASIDEKKTYPIASLTGVGLKIRSGIRVKSTFPLISG
jgi:hypothetical protein